MQGNRERGCFGLATGRFCKGRSEGLQKRLAGASKMLGRAQEAGRHEARVTGGWLAKLAGGWRKYAPEMLFAEQEGSGGLYGSGGSLKLFLEGALGLGGLYGSFWGLWGSAGFVRAQGGIALRFPFPFTDLL